MSVLDKTKTSIRRSIIGGGVVSALLVFGIGGWAALAQFSGAVIAPGALVVDTNLKKIQHPTGGVVAALNVSEGQFVNAGDVLIRLDETLTRANFSSVTKGIDELLVRQARLSAERDGQAELDIALDLLGEPDQTRRLIAEEGRLLQLRASARAGQKEQLRERTAQLREQIQGMTDQLAAKKKEIGLIGEELKGVRDLWSKNLVPITRVTALERDAARLEGERGAIISSIAQTRGRITETELQIIQVDQDLRAEVGRELAEIRSRLSDLVEKRVAAEDQLKRVDIRAPIDGYIHQLAVHTVGGVISPSEPAMFIVPNADTLRVEVRIAPQDIDSVRQNQQALLRFSAFNQTTTPELTGSVSLVSADVTQDPKTGATFYLVRIKLEDEQLRRLIGLKLTPGMPVEAFILTGKRTVISYLTKPLTDHVAKAFRER